MAKHCGAVGFVEISAKEGFSQDANGICGTIGSVVNFACYVAFANNLGLKYNSEEDGNSKNKRCVMQ